MTGTTYLAVTLGAVAAVVVSSGWYTAFANLGAMAVAKRPPAWKLLAEFARSLAVAYVLARFVVRLGVDDWTGAVRLGAWLWIGFPLAILVGSVLWESVSWKQAAIHAGDWLVKLLLLAIILVAGT